tara:strand:- start:678 stop:1340 length:663 start_codon:yes stop_codon:yes gene_type:complete
MELFKNTFYINLEKRKDRNEHVLNELRKIGIKGKRFNAIVAKDGAVGCTLSHIRLLEIAMKEDYEEIFICEDDITFLDKGKLIDSITKFNENIKDWDMLLLGGNVLKPYNNINNYCLKITNCQTTTGYIVKKKYYETLHNNYKEGLLKLLKDPKNKREFAIDIYWKILQPKDNWYLLFPLTVTQYENYSDIEDKVTNYNHLMLDSEKTWFYNQFKGLQFR